MLKKPKQLKKPKSKNSAWRVFSEYIRTRDKWVCVLCQRSKENGYVMQAGHVVPVGNNGNTIKYLEDDVFCQCDACNRLHAKNPSAYFNWYDSKFPDKREEIHYRKNSSKMLFVSMDLAFPSNDFQSVYDHYIKKLNDLKAKSSV